MKTETTALHARGVRRELSLSHEGPHLDQWVEYAVLPYTPYHGRDCCWSEHCGPQYGCAPVEMREQVLRTYPAPEGRDWL